MRTPAAWWRGVRHPEAFHGRGRPGAWFEGWYLKLISADRSQRWAVIPGVFRGDGSRGATDEAFVQVLDGLTGRSWYHRFDPDQFWASEDEFAVIIAGNRFDASGITLDLPQVRGRVDFSSPMQPYPVTARTPGIMGWYAYLPIMECYHAIVSFGHELAGRLVIEGVECDFTGGRGYSEKDWGRSFPSGYVWAASNHLDHDGVPIADASLVASTAIIPGLGRSFRGTIVALQRGPQISTWATWNGSRDDSLELTDSHVQWRLRGPDGSLELRAERVRGGLLHAPLRSAMHRRVEETLDARLEIHHVDPEGSVFDAVGQCSGLEVFGDLDSLTALPGRAARTAH